MPELTPASAFLFGVLHAIGCFDLSNVNRHEKREESEGFFEAASLTGQDTIDTAAEKAYFALGETTMASLLALSITAPAYFLLAERSGTVGALTAAVLIFLPLFVFVPKLIRYATKADTGAVIAAFGRNEQIRKVFWTVFLALAAYVLAQVAEPGLAEQILGVLAGI